MMVLLLNIITVFTIFQVQQHMFLILLHATIQLFTIHSNITIRLISWLRELMDVVQREQLFQWVQ